MFTPFRGCSAGAAHLASERRALPTLTPTYNPTRSRHAAKDGNVMMSLNYPRCGTALGSSSRLRWCGPSYGNAGPEIPVVAVALAGVEGVCYDIDAVRGTRAIRENDHETSAGRCNCTGLRCARDVGLR